MPRIRPVDPMSSVRRTMLQARQARDFCESRAKAALKAGRDDEADLGNKAAALLRQAADLLLQLEAMVDERKVA